MSAYRNAVAKGLNLVDCPHCEARPQRKDLPAHMEAQHGISRGGHQGGQQQAGGARAGTKKHRNQERHNRAARNHATGKRNGSR